MNKKLSERLERQDFSKDSDWRLVEDSSISESPNPQIYN